MYDAPLLDNLPAYLLCATLQPYVRIDKLEILDTTVHGDEVKANLCYSQGVFQINVHP